MVAGVFAELAREQPRRRFTIGIDDDVSGTSVDYDPSFDIESPDTVRAIFFGLGSDGTVSANKNTIKILGSEEGLHAQAYFVYDSKKSGSQTESHLRFGPGSHPGPLPGDRSQFRWLPSVPVPRQGRRARSGRPRRDAAAELPAALCEGLGRAAPPGPGTDPGQADHALHRRRRPNRARSRAGRPHQHRPADLLLRDLGRAAPRAGHRPDQGIGGEDVRQPRRRGAGQGTGRGGRRRGRVAADRRADTGHLRPRTGSDGARVSAGVRPHRDRGDDGRTRKPPAGQRTSGGRHLPERHDGLREAQHLRPGRGVGFRQLHPVRQLRASSARTV